MIGSEIREKILNHNWTFKSLMNMDDAIRVLIDDMDISLDKMISYLGEEWAEKVNDAFQSKVIPEMKDYLIGILDNASVNLPKDTPHRIDEEIESLPVAEDNNLSKLKAEIKKNTKQL